MKPATVLIVEDDHTTQELARLVLEGAGYDVQTVESAEQASAHCDATVPDVVLMDRELPGMNGLELTRQLKNDERTSGAIVLAFTSCTTPADDAMAIEAGSDGFVHKPFDVAGLLRTVGWHVSTRAARNGDGPPPSSDDSAPPRGRSAPADRSSPGDVARDTLSIIRMSAIIQALQGDTMKIARTLLCSAMLIASAAAVSAAQTATQTVTFSVAAINQVSVTGSAPTLAIVTAVAGSAPTQVASSGITWAVTTNQTGAKITGSIPTAMPTGLTLSANLTAPTGAASPGALALGTSAVDLVTGITKQNQAGMALTYTLDATSAAGVVASASRLVTYTITGGT